MKFLENKAVDDWSSPRQKKKKKDRDNYSDKKRGKILYSRVWLNPLTSYEEKSQQNYQLRLF